MAATLTLAGQPVELGGPPVTVTAGAKMRTVSPNGLADAVFEGGGMKGIGHVGALTYAEEIGLRWVNVAGTSAGAIVAALVAAGYTMADVKRIMQEEIDFPSFQDGRLNARLPELARKTWSFLRRYGFHTGNAFEHTMAKYLADRGVHTFRDLIIPDFPSDSPYRYRLRAVASDVSRGKMIVLPQDIAAYGIDPDELSVAQALRMSMSIPAVFRPVKLQHASATSFVVDGGLLSNYPVHLFDGDDGVPEWPTFGFNLREEENPTATIANPLKFGRAIWDTMFSAIDRRYIEEENWDRTIAIPTLGVKTEQFDLSRDDRKRLFQSGYDAAKNFFETWWDWDRHAQARARGVTMEKVEETA